MGWSHLACCLSVPPKVCWQWRRMKCCCKGCTKVPCAASRCLNTTKVPSGLPSSKYHSSTHILPSVCWLSRHWILIFWYNLLTQDNPSSNPNPLTHQHNKADQQFTAIRCLCPVSVGALIGDRKSSCQPYITPLVTTPYVNARPTRN